MKLLKLLLVFLISGLVPAAFAGDKDLGSKDLHKTVVKESGKDLGFYFGGFAGLSNLSDENSVSFDSGEVYGGVLGYSYANHLAAELSYDRSSHDVKGTSSSRQQSAYSLNGLYDLGAVAGFKPYVGAGLAYVDPKSSDNAWAYNGIAGLNVGLAQDVSVGVRYTYRSDLNDLAKDEDLHQQLVTVGLNYHF